jgi:hypothetical protein
MHAKAKTGATVSVVYVPPAGAAAAIWEAVEAELDLALYRCQSLAAIGRRPPERDNYSK